MDEMAIMQGEYEGFLVADCTIKDVYSGLALVEVDNGTQFGHIAFPVADFGGVGVNEGDRVRMILLLRPVIEDEPVVG